MFTHLLMAAALTPGQVPPGYPPVYIPVTQPGMPPAALPMAPPPGTPMPMPMAPGGMPPAANGNGNGAPCTDCEKPEEEAPAPTKYLLEKSIAETRLGKLFDNRGIRVYGWTQMSYNVSSASQNNAPVFMIDRAGEFMMNQNYLHAEKTLDTSKKEFQLGWLMDWILPGTDARTTIPRGLWDDQLRQGPGGTPKFYPIDPFQFYVQAYLPNLGGEGTTVKVGRFATHVGYELVQAPDTPFISRSYMFQYNPFTHTGVWATTQLNDTWTIGNGFATGSDTFIDPANRLTYLGQIKWAPPEGKTSVAFNVVVTDPTFDASEAFAFYNFYNLLITRKLGDDCTLVLDAGFSHINDVPGIGNTNWYGAAGYAVYNISDKVTSTLRAEVFEDTDGFRTGFRGLYTEVTYGLAFKPCDALLIRPSVRYDYNANSRPFEGDRDLFTTALDVIIRW